MSPEQSSGPAEKARRRSRPWSTLVAGALVVYAVIGWAVVRYSPRQHTLLHTPSGDAKLIGAKPFVQGGSRRLQVYIDDRDATGDDSRAAEILQSLMPDHPADDLRSIGVTFVGFHGIWPVTFTTNRGYVFARSPQGGWLRADPDQLRDHLTAVGP